MPEPSNRFRAMLFPINSPSLRQLLRPLLAGLLLLLSFPRALPARPRPHYPVAGAEQPVALLHAGKATYLVTAHSVFRLEGKEFVRKQQLTSIIQCAAVADSALWLGTHSGVQTVNTSSFKTHSLNLPGAEATPSITAVFRDA